MKIEIWHWFKLVDYIYENEASNKTEKSRVSIHYQQKAMFEHLHTLKYEQIPLGKILEPEQGV